VDPSQVLPREPGQVSRVDVLRARLKAVRGDLAGLQTDLAEGYSKTLAALVRAKEAEEERVGQELQDELARTVRSAAAAWQDVPSLVDMIREGGDEARLKLRPVLRQVVEGIYVVIVPHGAAHLAYLQVFFTGGQAREYIIYRRQAQGGFVGSRPAAWSVATWTGGWGTHLEARSLKDQATARRVRQCLSPLTPTPTAGAVSQEGGDQGDDDYHPADIRDLVRVMEEAATAEGGKPDPAVIGPVIEDVLFSALVTARDYRKLGTPPVE
jgi:hypothetical protein